MGRLLSCVCVILFTQVSFANICIKAFQQQLIKPSSNITEIEKKYLIQDHHSHYLTSSFKQYFSNWNHLVQQIKNRGDVVTQGFLDAHLHFSIAKKFGLSTVEFVPKEVRIIKVIRTQKNNKTDYIYSVKGEGTYSRPETEFYITEKQYSELWSLTLGRRVYRLRLNVDILTSAGLKEISLDYYLDRKLFIAEVEFKTEREGELFESLGKDVTEILHYKNANLAN